MTVNECDQTECCSHTCKCPEVLAKRIDEIKKEIKSLEMEIENQNQIIEGKKRLIAHFTEN